MEFQVRAIDHILEQSCFCCCIVRLIKTVCKMIDPELPPSTVHCCHSQLLFLFIQMNIVDFPSTRTSHIMPSRIPTTPPHFGSIGFISNFSSPFNLFFPPPQAAGKSFENKYTLTRIIPAPTAN